MFSMSGVLTLYLKVIIIIQAKLRKISFPLLTANILFRWLNNCRSSICHLFESLPFTTSLKIQVNYWQRLIFNMILNIQEVLLELDGEEGGEEGEMSGETLLNDINYIFIKHIYNVEGRAWRLPQIRTGNLDQRIHQYLRGRRVPHSQGLCRHHGQVRDLQKYPLLQKLQERHLPNHPSSKLRNQWRAEEVPRNQ